MARLEGLLEERAWDEKLRPRVWYGKLRGAAAAEELGKAWYPLRIRHQRAKVRVKFRYQVRLT